MNDLTEKLMNDPFLGESIPGQSLTSSPGIMPYERPPMTSSPFQAYNALRQGMYQEDTQKDIAEMVLAGLTCETVATSFVMIAFSKGMFNPDTAELIKPFLAVDVFKIAKMHKVKDVVLENSVKAQHSGDIEDLRSLKEDLAPDNMLTTDVFDEDEYNETLKRFDEAMNSSDQTESVEGFMTKPQGVE